jgi:hypothetical protein
MPRQCRTPYTCPCCNYNTTNKTNILHHFYKLKKLCPKTFNDIELTEEIKKYVIANRVYHIPAPIPVINNTNNINQIINYNNTINNLITNMDTIDKLTKFVTFNSPESKLIDIDAKLAKKFQKNVARLEANKQDQDIDKHVLLEMIDQVCSLADEHFKDFNIIYDDKFNRLKLYDSTGVWEESMLTVGMRTLLIKVQEHYFDAYEKYLIRKIRADDQLNGPRQMRMLEHLIDYYRFIACFDIDPYVKSDINDTEILYNMDDDRYDCCAEYTDDNRKLVFEFRDKYIKTRDSITKCFANETKKEVVNIIKNISKKNVDELNKKVIKLFNMDEEFKKIILP